MRTTLDLDDDILSASRELARARHTTAGKVISELVREALTRSKDEVPEEGFLGFRPFPSRGVVVTNDIIDRLREEGE